MSSNDGLFQYQPGASTSTTDSQFPQGNANINPRSAATGNLLLPQAMEAAGTPGSAASFRIAEENAGRTPMTKNQAIQSLLINSINDPDTTVALQERLIQAGYLSPKSRSFVPGSVGQDDATFFAVSNLLDDSIRAGVPYEDILQKKVANHPKAAEQNYAYYLNKFGAGATLGTAATTKLTNRTSSNAALSSPTDAQAALTQAMREHLGRAPTRGEVAAFHSALNALQAANPTVTQAQVETDTPAAAPGQTAIPSEYARSATSSGGVDAATAATNYLQGNYQQEADSHSIVGYVNAFESLLKGGG